jgi:hypothetical protein
MYGLSFIRFRNQGFDFSFQLLGTGVKAMVEVDTTKAVEADTKLVRDRPFFT